MRITLNFQNGKQLAFDPKLEKDQITKVLRTENDVVSTPVRDSMSD